MPNEDAPPDAEGPADVAAELALLRRKLAAIGEIGRRREEDWQRLASKLEGQLDQYEKRIAKRGDQLAEQARYIDLLENRTRKLRGRLAEARARSQSKDPATPAASGSGEEPEGGAATGSPSIEAASDGSLPVEADPARPTTRSNDDPPTREDPRRLLSTPAIGRSTRAVGRVAFFTALVGDYDVLGEPGVVDVGADYFVFTDQARPEDIWQPRPLRHSDPNPTRMARFVKLHPHEHLDGYDFAIWLDANLRPAAVAEAFIPASSDFDLLAWHHPKRDCVYDEAEVCVSLGKDDPEIIAAQVQRLRDNGYPEKAGLVESSVLVVNLKRPGVRGFFDAWWRALDTGSYRDQLSFNPTLRDHPDINLGYLGEPGVSSRTDPRIIYRHHQGSAAGGGDSGVA